MSEIEPDAPSDDRRPTYPPPGQVLSALGIEVSWVDDDQMIGRSTVDTALLARDGRTIGIGSLVPFVDLVAGVRSTALTEGDWLATSDIWLNERATIASGPITAGVRVLRAGRRTIVSAVEVEAGGRSVASGTIEYTRIRREASNHASTETRHGDGWNRVGSGALLDRPLEEACGFRLVDPEHGVVELGRSAFVANSTGTLQGGVVALLADVSAATLVGPEARTVDLHYRFLAPTGDGPARSRAELVRVDGRDHTVRVEVVDGADDTLVGWAVCRVKQPG